ncbi:MAG: TonB-dependent receptor plug domain-containing protein [Elusimicrobiales bacterium]
MRILLISLLFCAAPAAAQQSPGDLDFFQATLGDILDTPLLAASYAAERPSDAAAAAYVLNAETLAKRGYATLADLFDDLPQFQLQRNSDVRRLNLVSVRGIPNNERLVILYDGIRVSPPTGDLMAIAGQYSLRGAERVEVVLGPMSSVYGADAFSGVINVVTRSAGASAAGLSYGTFDSRSAGFSALAHLSKKGRGAPSASLTYETSGAPSPRLPEYYKEDYAWYNNQYQAGQAKLPDDSVTGVPVTKYDAAAKASFLQARLNLGEVELGLVKMDEEHSSSTGVKPEYTLYSEDARFGTGVWTVYGRHSYASPDESWKLNTVLSYFDYEISPETRFVNSFSGYDDAYKYASSKTAYLEQTLSLRVAEELPLLLGFSYQENAVLPYTADLGHKFDTGVSPLSQDFVYNGSTIPVDFHSLRYSNTGAFMRLQLPRFGHAVLSLGLRYDNNTAYGETWNPRAGLVWRPGGSEHTVLKAMYGEAYLAPSPFYTHKHFGAFVSSPSAPSGYHSFFFHVPNENLKPEKIRSAELSLAHDFNPNFRLSLNPYYNKVHDLIQDVIIGPGTFHGVDVDTLERAENSGTMETYGATVKVDAVFRAGGWGVEPWAAYTHSEGRLDGDPIPFNSRHVVQAGFSAARGRWVITPKAVYRSYTRNQDGGRVAPYTVADLYINYSRSSGGFSAWLKLNNLFDRRYYNAAYGGGPDHLAGAPQTPFGASAGMTFKF